jgi:hypothetical protein
LFWEKSTGKEERMVNYEKLAIKAKMIQDADKLALDRHKELRAYPCSFFERVKAQVVEEMKKANVELRKRGAREIGRNHLPGFEENIFLTYGTDSLCRVGLGIMREECRVTAVISGPPNGYEISRREYLCSKEANCQEILPSLAEGLPPDGSCPEEIAVDIISGIMRGGFD